MEFLTKLSVANRHKIRLKKEKKRKGKATRSPLKFMSSRGGRAVYAGVDRPKAGIPVSSPKWTSECPAIVGPGNGSDVGVWAHPRVRSTRRRAAVYIDHECTARIRPKVLLGRCTRVCRWNGTSTRDRGPVAHAWTRGRTSRGSLSVSASGRWPENRVTPRLFSEPRTRTPTPQEICCTHGVSASLVFTFTSALRFAQMHQALNFVNFYFLPRMHSSIHNQLSSICS